MRFREARHKILTDIWYWLFWSCMYPFWRPAFKEEYRLDYDHRWRDKYD